MAALSPLVVPAAGGAQEDGLRFGVTVGGTGFLGLTFEVLEGQRSIELTVGTWSFDDVSLSVVGRQYFGASALRPVVGLGLWTVVSWPKEPGERTGVSVVARAPVGADWRVVPGQFLSLDVNVNRALWVRHKDPQDDRPPNARLIPLPGLAWRWQP